MIEHINMIQIPYLNIWSMLLSGQVLHRLIEAIQLFWFGGTSVSDTTNESFGMNNFARTSNCGVLSSYQNFISRCQLSHGRTCKKHPSVFARYKFYLSLDDTSKKLAWKQQYEYLLNIEFPWSQNLSHVDPVAGHAQF